MLTEHLEAAAQADGGNIICYDSGNTEKGTSHSYGQLLEVATEGSQAIRARDDFERGKVVLIHFISHWDNIVWFWAVLLAGGIPAMSPAVSNDPTQRAAHWQHLFDSLTSPLCLTRAARFGDFSGQDAIRPIAVDNLGKPDTETEEQPAAAPEEGECTPDENSPAVLMLTSGSTGRPKAASLSHAQITAALEGKFAVVPLPEGTSMMNWVAMDHVAGFVEIHLQALYKQRDQIHVQPADLLTRPLTFLDLIDRHRVSRTFGPNFFLTKLRDALRHHQQQSDQTEGETDAAASWDLSCLKYIATGGEPNVTRTCADLSKQLQRYGTPENVIVPGFGMTETCAGAIFNTSCPQYDLEHDLEITSVGHCMPGIQMRITGDEQPDVPLAPGELGNLEVTGPVVFSGYFNNATATQETFTSDGWFKTSDRARIDEDGTLTLVGRRKDTMIVNGVKYSPADVERVLEEARIPGIMPGFVCCFSSFPADGSRATEEVCLVYVPTYAPEDMLVRAKTAQAIGKAVLMATGLQLRIVPLRPGILQKSSLGKLSRNNIKKAYEQGDYQHYQTLNDEAMQLYHKITREPPKDEFEARLLDSFVHSLGLSKETFDVTTPVFDMGVTSIELIRLKKNLEESFELVQDIPIISLLTNPTVRDLAPHLRPLLPGTDDDDKTLAYNPLVTLQSAQGKTKKPLWLVHPGAGEVLIFLNLAKFLADRPVYALRARGFNAGEEPFTSIPEIIDTYHEVIKKTQPEGPYALAGYSYGSMLAFELGKRLEQTGDTVAFLGSFNLPPHIKYRMRALDWTSCLFHLTYFLDLMSQKQSAELQAQLQGTESEDEILSLILENSSAERMAELALTSTALLKWATIAHKLHRIAVDYDPTDSIQGIDVFYCHPLAVVAQTKELWLSEHMSKWADFTRSEPRFHDVGGSHYTIIGPEHVFDFQRTLRKALEERGI